MVDIPDYMMAELSDEISSVDADAASQTTQAPAEEPAAEVLASPCRFEVTVEGMKYVAEDGRLHTQVTNGDKTIQSFVSSLIVVVATARDDGSSNWGKVIRFEDQDGTVKQVYIANRDITTDGKAVVKKLVNEGLIISTQRGMVDALVHYLNLAPPLEGGRAVCTDRIGWHDNVYLFPDNSVIGRSDTRVVYTGGAISNHNTAKGTLQSWTENVAALCKGNSLLILAVSVAFASVLLRLLKIESGGYHFFGESSTGKSTSLYVAASVHGEPVPLIGSWRSTANGTEAKAKRCNDSLMINDELHQSTQKDAGDVAYLVMNGKGKQRANVLGEARDVSEWRLNLLSSGEIAYSAFIQEGGKKSRAGQEVRMVDISADMGRGLGVFEDIHEAPNSHAFAEQLKTASMQNYGVPIREFLQRLIERLDTLDSRFAEYQTRFLTNFVPEDAKGQVKRVASKFAVAAMAGELATEMGLTGWAESEAFQSVGCAFSRWLSSRGTVGQQEDEKAVEQVKNFLLRHGMSRFLPIEARPGGGYQLENPDRPNTVNNQAGFRITHNDNPYEFIVFSDAYVTEMCEGLNPKSVTKTLVERGFLNLDGEGKPQIRHRLPGIDQARVYHFNSSILSDADGFAPAEPAS